MKYQADKVNKGSVRFAAEGASPVTTIYVEKDHLKAEGASDAEIADAVNGKMSVEMDAPKLVK